MNLDQFVVWLRERGTPEAKVPVYRTAAARLLAWPGARTQLETAMREAIAAEEAKGNRRSASLLRETSTVLLEFAQATGGTPVQVRSPVGEHVSPAPADAPAKAPAASSNPVRCAKCKHTQPYVPGGRCERCGVPFPSFEVLPPDEGLGPSPGAKKCPRCGGEVVLYDFTMDARRGSAIVFGSIVGGGFLGGFFGGLAGGGLAVGTGSLFAASGLAYRCTECGRTIPPTGLSSAERAFREKRRGQLLMRGVGFLSMGVIAAIAWLWSAATRH
ncbi:MAG: hypothetical protein ACKVPX_17235 [Myxococcaceae bacterium]